MATQAVTELIIDAGPAEQGASRYQAAMDRVAAAEQKHIDRQARIDAAMQQGIAVVTQTSSALDRQARAWESVVAKIDPVAKATLTAEREMARAVETTTLAVENGLTTRVEAERVLASLYQQQVVRIDEVRQAQLRLTASTTAEADATQRLAAAQRMVNSTAHGTGSFQTANIAAQFQDVAVTAAMGMDPKMIALQQGTQLSGALAGVTSLRGAVSALGVAFGSLLSPVSLVTIAAVGLGAAGIQAFMGWLNSSHQTIRTLEEYRKQIDDIVDGWDSAKKAADAAFDAANRQPKGVVVSDLQQAIRDQQKAANDLNSRIESVNATMERNIALFQHQKDVFANDSGVQSYLGPIIDQLQNLHNMGISASSTSEQLDVAASSVRELMRTADNPAMREFAGQLDGLIQALRGVQAAADAANGSVQAMTATTMSMGDFNASFASLTGQADAIAQLKALTPDLRTKDQQAEDIYKANSGSDVNGDLKRQLDYTKSQLAAEKAMQDALKSARLGAKADEKADNAYDRITRSAEQQIAQSRAQAQTLGMTDEAANAFLHTQELLNQAANDNIKLTPDQTVELGRLGTAMAQVDENTRRLTDAYNFGRSTLGGFFSDFKQNLMSGTSLWSSFANAATSALDKISDKAMDMAVDGVWDWIYGAIKGFMPGGSIATGAPIPSGGFVPGVTGPKLYADGGYTGGLPPDRIAGFVHGGEYVFSAAATSRLGLGYLDSLHRSAKGYADGGYVPPRASNANQANDNWRSAAPVVNVNFINKTGEAIEQKVTKRQTSNGLDIDVMIAKSVTKPGGPAARGLESQYGLKRQLTKR